VVVRDVPPHAVCFGNPARVRRATRAGDEAVSAEDLAVLSLPPVERP
jgi:acetyltransferase-like isoleucine patch superfamily enzyme